MNIESMNLEVLGYLEGELLNAFWSKNEHNLFIMTKGSSNLYCLQYNEKIEIDQPEQVPYIVKPKVISLNLLNYNF